MALKGIHGVLIMVFISDGIYQNQDQVDKGPTQPGKGVGRMRYKDISGPDGKPDGKIDYDYDRTWIGDNVVIGNAGLSSVVPKYEYGFAINLTYKSFDLSMYWQGVAGIKSVRWMEVLQRFLECLDSKWFQTIQHVC